MNRRLLVVDDQERFRDHLATELRSAGYDCAATGSKAEALSVAERFRPHLSLLDICLPDGEGVMLALELLQSPTTARVPAILMTGFARTDQRVRAWTAAIGPAPVLGKPFGLSDALALIERRFNSSGKERIRVDRDTRKCWIDGISVAFGDKRFDVLCALLDAEDWATRDLIHSLVWPLHDDSRIVDTTIRRLRENFSALQDFDIEMIEHRYRLKVRDPD